MWRIERRTIADNWHPTTGYVLVVQVNTYVERWQGTRIGMTDEKWWTIMLSFVGAGCLIGFLIGAFATGLI